MGNWIAAIATANGLRGWRLPDGFYATAPDEEGLRAALGRDLPIRRVSGAARPMPCKVIMPPVNGAIAPVGQSTPPDESGEAIIAVAGAIAPRPNWDGVVLVAGVRSCWVHVSAGEAISLQSFVSGQIADTFSVAPTEHSGFDEALNTVLSRPERLATLLARPDLTQGMIWGGLIGAELAASRAYWLGQQVLITGEKAELYHTALKMQGVPAEWLDEYETLKAGFLAIGA